MRKISGKRGFTLVELLIVIALLGALAIGLIGALDPFEQLKKGADTGRRDLVNQVQTAVLRYYATKNAMPWAATAGFSGQNLSFSSLTEGLSNMVGAGELKSNFTDIYKNDLTQVWVTYVPGGTSSSVTVKACYKPDSKSFQVEANTKYDMSGVEITATGAGACKSTTPSNSTMCYWCVQ
jgi:prepilin-type N-terminal cleavage/methylation domain-containing protein